MPDPVLLIAAALTGLAGAGHCAGMCGGIAAALAHAAPHGRTLATQFAYSAGRITTYTLLGLLAGLFAALLAPDDTGIALAVGRGLTGVVLLAIGLYLLGVARWMAWLEQAGARAWRHVSPLARRLVPPRTLASAWALGMLWGLLPCGLVYGGLLYAATSGSALAGGATMLAFGVGTLPAVLGLGIAGQWLARHAQQVKRGSGLLMLAYGAWTLVSTAIALPAILAGTCRSPGDVLQVVLSALTHVK